MKSSSLWRSLAAALVVTTVVTSAPVRALVLDVTVDGSDAIFLAGRTDLSIPPASDPWVGGMIRHAGPTPEEIRETLPPVIAVSAGDTIRALDPASGGISFFNGFGGLIFGPEGGAGGITNLGSFGGISGFLSDGRGPLAGVFLDDGVPSGTAPPRLDFRAGGIGTDFLALTPGLGEVFFIGDGVTSGGDFHVFTAPPGATRLALGIPDGFSFVGAPGAYDDNDGAYRIRIGINEIPTISEPVTLALLGLGLAGLGFGRGRRGRPRVGALPAR